MHHGGYSGPLLQREGETVQGLAGVGDGYSHTRAQDTYADPGVFEGLCSRDAFTRVNGEHLVDEIFGLGSNGVPLGGRELSGERPETRPVLQGELKAG